MFVNHTLNRKTNDNLIGMTDPSTFNFSIARLLERPSTSDQAIERVNRSDTIITNCHVTTATPTCRNLSLSLPNETKSNDEDLHVDLSSSPSPSSSTDSPVLSSPSTHQCDSSQTLSSRLIGKPGNGRLLPVLYNPPMFHSSDRILSSDQLSFISHAQMHHLQALLRQRLRKERRKGGSRKPRQAYDESQLQSLEQEFIDDMYLSPIRRLELAKRLALSEVQVRTWFQNRRTKLKKQLLAANILHPANSMTSMPNCC